jgi:hypothetical protein
MRYHHGYGCYGHDGWHGGCGPGPGYGPGPDNGYGWGWVSQDEDPRPYRRRGRLGGVVARQSTATQLEAYLASLRDEIRGVEQDLRDLGIAEDAGVGEDKA